MTEDELRRQVQLLEREARLRQELSTSLDDYIKGLRDAKKAREVISKIDKDIVKLNNEILALSNSTLQADIDAVKAAKEKVQILEEQKKKISEINKGLENALSSVNKQSLMLRKFGTETLKGFEKITVGLPNLIKRGYGDIRGLGLFEMDKSMKSAALSMGILSKGTEGFRNTIKGASLQTNMMGIGIKELSLLQSNYSEGLGRSVELSQDGLVAMGQIAAATGLGVEGTSQMAVDMEKQGLSAERTGKFIEKSMNNAHKMGLNASKVIKNIVGGTKMLNKYNFKEGTAGLEKMSRTVTKLGVSMEFASSLADKMWDVGGAVEMSAQLQVMGGEWAKMADPFRLMYMARNDINGLTEELGNAAAASAKFNAKTGEFDLGAMEMHKLKIIAEQTGVAYDDLVTAGKNAAKFSKIKSQITFSVGGGKDGEDLKEYLTNKSFIDKNGKASIMVKGSPKLLNELNKADVTYLKANMEQKATMKDRAEAARTFDEQLSYFIINLKQTLLPLIESFNKKGGLGDKLDSFVKKFNEKGGWGSKISEFATTVGGWIASIGEFIVESPRLTAALLLAGKAIPLFKGAFDLIFNSYKWFTNGRLLAQGFNSAAMVNGSSSPWYPGQQGPVNNPNNPTNTGGFFGSKNLKTAGKGGAAGAALGVMKAMTNGEGFSGSNIGSVIGSVLGGAAGTFLDPFIGPLGTMLGAQLGGMLGESIGQMFEGENNSSNNDISNIPIGQPMHDAFFGGDNKNNNFSNFSESLGNDYSKGRAILQGGKINPIENKDDLVAMKPNGIVDNVMKNNNNSANIMKVDFGEIIINGKITVESPGNSTAAVDLMKNPSFIADLQRAVSSQIEKNKNGGINIAS